MTEMGPHARWLIERARQVHDPSPDARLRVREALARRGIEPAPTGRPAPSTASLGLRTSIVTMPRAVLLAITVGAVGIGPERRIPAAAESEGASRPAEIYVLAASAPASITRTAPAPSDVASPPSIEPSRAEPSGGYRAVIPKASRLPPVDARLRAADERLTDLGLRDGGHEAPALAGNADLGAELALLQDAERALAASDPARALASVEEHAARYPAGQLAEERESLRVRALCAAGRGLEAHQARAHFLEAFARAHGPLEPDDCVTVGMRGGHSVR